MSKVRILMLMGGPKYDLEWEFGTRLRKMSSFASGYLVTTSSSDKDVELDEFTVHPIHVEDRKNLLTRIVYVRSCIRLLRQARREGKPIELIITYDPMASGLPGLILSKVFRAKLVCEVNGDYSAWENYAQIRNSVARRVKRYLMMATARLVLRNAHGVKYLFPKQLEKLGAHIGDRQIAERFPNYVMVDQFSNLGEEKIVLLVGFPMYVKGVDIAVTAFKKVAAEFPEWRLKIMGYYPDRREIDALIGGHPQIFIQNPVLHRKIGEHFGRCGIVLLPSRTEGLPRVLVESLASGKPIVASRINGIPLVFDDGVQGILVEPNNPDEVADALSRLMSDTKTRSRMAAASKLRAQSHFSESAYFEQLKKFYDRILKGPQRN